MNPTTVQASLDWLHLVLGFLVLVGPVAVHQAAARGWIDPRKVDPIVKAFGIMQDVANDHDHGATWAQASVAEAQKHSREVVDLVTSAIPDQLLAPTAPAPSTEPPPVKP